MVGKKVPVSKSQAALDKVLAKVKPLPKKSEVEEHDRLTIIATFHHEQFGENPTSAQFRYSKILEKKHQPFVRRIEIGETPIPLIPEGCWIPASDIGDIIIENRAGVGFLVNPTKQQLDEVKRKILFLRKNGDDKGWEIPPTKPFIGTPEDPASLMLVSACGKIPVNLRIIAR